MFSFVYTTLHNPRLILCVIVSVQGAAYHESKITN